MSTITKQWLQQKIADMEATRDDIPFGLCEDGTNTLAAMKLALASLEAEPAPASVPEDVSGPLAHAYKELTPTFMRNHIGVFERYGIYPDGSAGIQAMRIALDGMDRRAAMLHGSDTELQRKAAIHDALCEKYNVDSLTDFVAWQRNHIAELEIAPPAPVGEGDAAVMPDYPGYVMTQRECFQAGKKAGQDEAGNSTVIPDWQAKAEKLAELYGSSFVVFRNGESPQCADPTKVIISFTDEGLGHGSAAPQQEVKL